MNLFSADVTTNTEQWFTCNVSMTQQRKTTNMFYSQNGFDMRSHVCEILFHFYPKNQYKKHGTVTTSVQVALAVHKLTVFFLLIHILRNNVRELVTANSSNAYLIAIYGRHTDTLSRKTTVSIHYFPSFLLALNGRY